MALFKYVENNYLLGRFSNIVARWPGSTHDSHIFHTSQICQQLEDNHNNLEQGILLGDNGYALKPYLMTPYHEPATANQRGFNRAHTKGTKQVLVNRLLSSLEIVEPEAANDSNDDEQQNKAEGNMELAQDEGQDDCKDDEQDHSKVAKTKTNLR
jgi:hypothetical protein